MGKSIKKRLFLALLFLVLSASCSDSQNQKNSRHSLNKESLNTENDHDENLEEDQGDEKAANTRKKKRVLKNKTGESSQKTLSQDDISGQKTDPNSASPVAPDSPDSPNSLNNEPKPPTSQPKSGPLAAKGRIFGVSTLGRVTGWAVNPADLDEQITVKFYLGGPKGQGVDAGTTQAFINADDEGMPGNHGFAMDLPGAAINGRQNSLYGYAVISGVEILFTDPPTMYTAWGPTEAGQSYFNSTIMPSLARCQGCHVDINYLNYLPKLSTPAPNGGGLATNNSLINKVGTLNGASHSGGSFCGNNAANGICANLQTWWQMEFATPRQ